MSLAVCGGGRHLPPMGSGCGGTAAWSPAAPAAVDSAFFPGLSRPEAAAREETTEQKDGQFDIWASIQSLKQKEGGMADDPPAPYVHPLLRRSASSLSQKSLEICTESLGSETGSEGTLSPDDLLGYCPTWRAEVDDKVAEEAAGDDDIATQDGDETVEEYVEKPPPPTRRPPSSSSRRNKLADVNYHCSIGRRSPARAFPPPLPSICRRDGPCLSMRRYRQDGRLVVEAVPAPSQNYLHAQRRGGRLVLTFIETTIQDIYPVNEEEPAGHEQMLQKLETEAQPVQDGAEEAAEARGKAPLLQSNADGDADEEEEEEALEEEGEEVEVVDRGIVVEIKVSGPPLPQNGGLKVQRSSVVINKFVGMPPWPELRATAMTSPPPRQIPLGSNAATSATALVAVAAAASSSLSIDERYWRNGKGPSTSARQHPSPEKLYFTSKRLSNRQDLLHQVRRCSEHHRPLFIREPCCIATS